MTSKAPAKDSSAGSPKKLKAHLDRLEKEYGSVELVDGKPALEQAICLILREGSNPRKAQKALKILEGEYVEWNELRVATPKEIVAVLAGLGISDLDDKISRILALLSRLFYDFHKKDLEFVKIFEPPQRQKIMNSLSPLGVHVTNVLLQYFEDNAAEPQGLIVTQEEANVLVKLGAIKKTSSLNVARKAAEKVISKSDWYRFHYLILREQEAA
jgi:endonuclease III